MITLSPFYSRMEIFDFRFLINHNHVILCRLTLIFRFLRVVWPELSDENLKNNFPRFYKISVLSRFGAILFRKSYCKIESFFELFELLAGRVDHFKNSKSVQSNLIRRLQVQFIKWCFRSKLRSSMISYHHFTQYLNDVQRCTMMYKDSDAKFVASIWTWSM